MEWDTLAKEHVLKNVASKIIVDDVLLYGRTSRQLLDYFRTVLDVLKHHRATLKLKKGKWFQDRCEFVGMDVAADGTQPAQSKNEAFAKIEQPNTWGDLHMLIGLFGFYSQFFPLHDLEIRPWRYILLTYWFTRVNNRWDKVTRLPTHLRAGKSCNTKK